MLKSTTERANGGACAGGRARRARRRCVGARRSRRTAGPGCLGVPSRTGAGGVPLGTVANGQRIPGRSALRQKFSGSIPLFERRVNPGPKNLVGQQIDHHRLEERSGTDEFAVSRGSAEQDGYIGHLFLRFTSSLADRAQLGQQYG